MMSIGLSFLRCLQCDLSRIDCLSHLSPLCTTSYVQFISGYNHSCTMQLVMVIYYTSVCQLRLPRRRRIIQRLLQPQL